MTFYEKFIDECAKIGMSPSVAMEEIGLNRSTLTGWKKGRAIPTDLTMGLVARFFGCELEDFAAARAESIALNAGNGQKKRRGASSLNIPSRIPLVGTIACGEPILAYENVEEMIPIPPHVHADFALKAKGESMINARIFPGDIVYIQQQPVVENGQIAAVLVGDEATLKKVYVFGNRLTLMPENPLFEPMNYVGEEMNQVQILGRAVAVTNFLDGERGNGR